MQSPKNILTLQSLCWLVLSNIASALKAELQKDSPVILIIWLLLHSGYYGRYPGGATLSRPLKTTSIETQSRGEDPSLSTECDFPPFLV